MVSWSVGDIDSGGEADTTLSMSEALPDVPPSISGGPDVHSSRQEVSVQGPVGRRGREQRAHVVRGEERGVQVQLRVAAGGGVRLSESFASSLTGGELV